MLMGAGDLVQALPADHVHTQSGPQERDIQEWLDLGCSSSETEDILGSAFPFDTPITTLSRKKGEMPGKKDPKP